MAVVQHKLIRDVKAAVSGPYAANAIGLLRASRPIRYDLIKKVRAG